MVRTRRKGLNEFSEILSAADDAIVLQGLLSHLG